MTLEQGLERVMEVIADDARHPYYDRTVNNAELYFPLVTGEGLGDMLRQFTPTETDENFKVRKEITEHIAPAVLTNIRSIFSKVPRAQYSRDIWYESDDDGTRTKEIESVLSTFWGTRSLDKWMQTRFIELNFIDPNTFVVVEFGDYNPAKLLRPYPFEVSAADALDFKYKNHILQYLIARTPKVVQENGRNTDRFRFTLYLANQTVVLDPLPKTGTRAGKEKMITEEGIVWLKREPYLVSFPTPHNLGEVPARAVGYVRDLASNGRTYLPPYDAAIPYLKKTLKINSEHDISLSWAAHPTPIRYAPPCSAQGCSRGRLLDGSICMVCEGSGRERVTSAIQEIVVDMPQTKEEMIDLENLLIYKSAPIDTLKFQAETIDRLTDRAKEIVFNGDLFTRAQVSDTATGKRLDLENAYDTMFNMAEAYADWWEWAVTMCARVVDREEGLVRSMIFGKDFKLKTVSEMFEEMERVQAAGVGPEVKRVLEGKVMAAILAEDPVELSRYATKEFFDPFTGLTSEEKVMALNSPLVPNRDKALYLNFGSIFDRIEQETPGFYQMKTRDQRAIIDAAVAKLMAELGEQNAPPAFRIDS